MSITKEDLNVFKSALQTLILTVDGMLNKIDEPSGSSAKGTLTADDEARMKQLSKNIDELRDMVVSGSWDNPKDWHQCIKALATSPKAIVTSNTPGCEWSGNQNQIRVKGEISHGMFNGDEVVGVLGARFVECVFEVPASLHNCILSRCLITQGGNVTLHGALSAIGYQLFVGMQGQLKIMGDAFVSSCVVHDGGLVSILDNGHMRELTTVCGGSAVVKNGQLDSAFVSSGGNLRVDKSPYKVHYISAGENTSVCIGDAEVTSVTGNGSHYKISTLTGATVCNLQMSGGLAMLGGKIDYAELHNAEFTMFSGLAVKYMIANNTDGYVNNNTVVNRLKVGEQANVRVSSDGIVEAVDVWGGCTRFTVSSGGSVDRAFVEREATMRVDGRARQVEVSGSCSYVYVHSGAVVDKLIVFGSATVAGGLVEEAELHSAGLLIVKDGGRIRSVSRCDGSMTVESGAVVEHVRQEGGQLTISSGGICKIDQRGSGSIETMRGGYSYVCCTKGDKE